MLGAVLLASCGGCASTRKLADGGPVDGLMYGVLGFERDPKYYYEKLRDSHEEADGEFTYRLTEDVYLVDKSVDAAGRLGSAEYSRLEGQAQAAVLLSNVLLDDPAALARTQAASSLTQLGLKLPRYARPADRQDRIERGQNLLAAIRELDALHARTPLDPGAAGRRRFLIDAIGDMHIVDLEIAREAVKPFYLRPYLIDATDPALRSSIDTAIVKRITDLIRLSLQAALDAPHDHVRREAIIGLKLLADRRAEDAVLARLPLESHWQVRAEAVEYLGKMASEKSTEALLPILDDGDPTLRHKARRALVRIAGRDYGRDRSAWQTWAESRFPQIAVRAAEARAARERRAAGRSGGGAAASSAGPPAATPAPPSNDPAAPDDEPLPAADDVLPPANDVLPSSS